jgi:transposase
MVLIFVGSRQTARQRSQSETVNSMMKRNLGEYLRSIRPRRRKQEMLLRSITHNLMLGEVSSED